MNISIGELEAYLADHYCKHGNEQSLFMKLVDEVGEVAEVLNKRAGRKANSEPNLHFQLGAELADVIHYAVAIAAINNIDINDMILQKDKLASVKYHHRTNLEAFTKELRQKEGS